MATGADRQQGVRLSDIPLFYWAQALTNTLNMIATRKLLW
jgi:hypothetical protein